MNAQQASLKNASPAAPAGYAARLDIEYSEKLDRLTTFFRLFMIIPIAIILGLLTGSGQTVTNTVYLDQAQHVVLRTRDVAGGIASGIAIATALMILFRQRYPRWWFNFILGGDRFGTRVGAYALLLTDRYPSTVEEQLVHLDVDYPDVEKDLKRGMPLVKWFLAIPHYFVLAFLIIGVVFVTIIAWFAILFTGSYPEGLLISLWCYALGAAGECLRIFTGDG